MRAFPVIHEMGGQWRGEPVEQLSLKPKADIVIHEQNRLSALNTLVMCDFAAYGIQSNTYRNLLSAATGITLNADEMSIIGERIWNLARLFNLREGFDREHDTLPRRFMEEPLPSGPSKGHHITSEDMSIMLNDYYQLRGWDLAGRPNENTLDRLGLGNTFKRPKTWPFTE